MNVTIPKSIKSNIDNIKSVTLETTTDKNDSNAKFISTIIPIDHIVYYETVPVANKPFYGCRYARYRVEFKDETTCLYPFDPNEKYVHTQRVTRDEPLESTTRHYTSYNEEHIRGASTQNTSNLLTFNNIKNIKCYIINLAKDKKRYKKSYKQLKKVGFKNIQRWEAVEPNYKDTIEQQLEVLGCTDTVHSINNVQEMACTASHITLLKDFLQSKDNYRIIFEDDIIMHTQFHEYFDSLQDISLDSLDVLFLGGWLWSYKNADIKIINNELGTNSRDLKSIEAHAYLINRNFAYRAIKSFLEVEDKLTIDMHYAYVLNDVEKCLVTASPHTSTNHTIFKNDDKKRCGIVYQSNEYVSNIQPTSKKIYKTFKERIMDFFKYITK